MILYFQRWEDNVTTIHLVCSHTKFFCINRRVCPSSPPLRQAVPIGCWDLEFIRKAMWRWIVKVLKAYNSNKDDQCANTYIWNWVSLWKPTEISTKVMQNVYIVCERRLSDSSLSCHHPDMAEYGEANGGYADTRVSEKFGGDFSQLGSWRFVDVPSLCRPRELDNSYLAV